MKEAPIYQHVFQQRKTCVLIPTYNNASSIAGVIEDVSRFTHDIIVVNDGSTDETLSVLEAYPHVQLVTYRKNRGKGWALRTGFAYALDSGYEYAVTLDADGQHYASDLPAMLEMISSHPGSIVIGARNMNTDNVPGKSNFGNRFSNFWFHLYTGITAPDTQSGYRLYPLKSLQSIRFFTNRYEFEVEVLVRAAWKDVGVHFVPVKVYYPPAEERVSHFRPFKDFSRISVLNTLLFFVAFFYIKPRNFFRSIIEAEKREQLYMKLLEPTQSAERKAFSIGFGIFMGIVPIWGFQLMIAIFFSVLLRLNKALVIATANISIPPMIPVILYASFIAGAPWMGDKAATIPLSSDLSFSTIEHNLQQYLAGSITLALVAGLAIGLISYAFMKLLNRKTGAAI